jgi:hypothetical protein
MEGAFDSPGFDHLIASLEAAADRVLDGPARERALSAWRLYPLGFEIVVHRAKRQATKNSVGLMLWMIDRGHHTAAELALERTPVREEPLEGSCFVCEAGGEVFAFGGQLFCRRHRDDQERFDATVRF